MPILPIDRPEPVTATLGLMLYPGTDQTDVAKSRAFAAQCLAAALKSFLESGGALPCDLTAVLVDAGQPLPDLNARWWGGRATGEAFKAFFALFNTAPALASWNNAIKLTQLIAEKFDVKGTRTNLWEAKACFQSVAHLWGAWAIREGKSFVDQRVDYDATADFQSFLAEAEMLRQWGQTWRARREKSEPPLPQDVWRVPEDWEPPTRKPGWPPTGMVPDIKVPEELLAELKPAGRPRKRA
jgi:hypothetical protein